MRFRTDPMKKDKITFVFLQNAIGFDLVLWIFQQIY